MRFIAKKQNDGTYIIYGYHYVFTRSAEAVKTGVRGCNVNRIMNKLYLELL